MCKLLLENGADVDSPGSDGVTPLLCALTFSNLEVINLLLANGANIRAVNANDETALHCAAGNPDVRMVQVVLDQGIDIDCRDCHGYTALDHAIGCGNFSVCEYLIRRGAVADGKTKEIDTPFSFLLWGGPMTPDTPKLVQILLEYGTNVAGGA